MSVIVTALLFAGRPNPSWTLPEAEAVAVLREISLNPGVIHPEGHYPWCLHYNGLRIDIGSELLASEFGLPAQFMIHTGFTRFETKAQEIAKRLVDLMFSGKVMWDSTIEGQTADKVLQGIILEGIAEARPKVHLGRPVVSQPASAMEQERSSSPRCSPAKKATAFSISLSIIRNTGTTIRPCN